MGMSKPDGLIVWDLVSTMRATSFGASGAEFVTLRCAGEYVVTKLPFGVSNGQTI